MVVDRIVGYPPPFSVDGDILTWTKENWDIGWYQFITNSHYVANVTPGTPESQPIIDVIGVNAENEFQIEVDDASGWSTGDRGCPIRQATVYYYASVQTADAAHAIMDTYLMGFPGLPDKRYFWKAAINLGNTSNTPVSMFGIYGYPTKFMVVSRGIITIGGDLSALTSQLRFENLEMTMGSVTAFKYSDTSGTGEGMRVTRCIGHDSTEGTVRTGAMKADSVQVDSCLMYSNQAAEAMYLGAPTLSYNNLVVYTGRHCIHNVSQASTYVNCGALGPDTGDLCWASPINIHNSFNNMSSDATAPGTNPVHNQSIEDLKLLFSNSNNEFVRDWRPAAGSPLFGAGIEIVGKDMLYDLNGKPYDPLNWPIGPCGSATIPCDLPNREDVLDTVTVGGESGLYAPALPNKVVYDYTFGASGVASSGLRVDADSYYVIDTHAYADPDAWTSGIFANIAENEVEISKMWGASGTQYTGSYSVVCDFPGSGYVTSGVIYDDGDKEGSRIDCPTASSLYGTVYGDPASSVSGEYSPDLPASGYVTSGVVYDFGSYEGARIDCPPASSVYETVYGDPFDPITGEYIKVCDFPSISYVSTGVVFDDGSLTGERTDCPPGSGIEGVTYGPTGIPFVGLFHVPGVDNTLTYDNVGGVAGNFYDVESSGVLYNWFWGASGTQNSGSYDEDYPADYNVIENILYGNGGYSGKWAKALNTYYKVGELFGVDGTSVTGVYGDNPILPSGFTATDNTTGGDILCEWTNVSEYVENETIVIYDDADDSIVGAGNATSSGVIIGGFTNGTPYTLKAKSYNGLYSDSFSNTNSATPTLAVSPTLPLQPVISVTSPSAGTVVITIRDSDGGDLSVFYQQRNSSSLVAGGTRIGDGTITVTGLTENREYDFIAIGSNIDGYYGLPSAIKFTVVTSSTDGPCIITPALISIYQEKIDMVINCMGKHVIALMPSKPVDCPNCGFNSRNRSSNGRYNANNPNPLGGNLHKVFQRNSVCPVCRGTGRLNTSAVRHEMTASVNWAPKDFVHPATGVRGPSNVCKIKTWVYYRNEPYLDYLRGAKTILVAGGEKVEGSPEMYPCELLSECAPRGLKFNRYFECFVERTD